jgi:hypothetical protein
MASCASAIILGIAIGLFEFRRCGHFFIVFVLFRFGAILLGGLL